MLRRAFRVTAVALVVGAGLTLPTGAARAAEGCAKPTGVYTGTTAWAQALLQPAQVWPIASGAGQTVAVISTGVDRANAQFGADQIRTGADVLPTGRTDPFTDCDGRGTFAAGIVAARPNDGTTFAGLAPAASLLAVRDLQATGDTSAGAGPLPDLLAAAITASVDQGATVVLVGVPAPQDSSELRRAVAAAIAAGVVVVSPATQGEGAVSYPTSYPGVIGVGAVDRSGAALSKESGDYIALSAPGSQLVSTSAGAAGTLGHSYPVDDPSFAAAYVAGAVAVLRSARPDLTPDQVAALLTFTADHPPNGRDPRLGWGTVDLLAAVTAQLPATVASPGSSAAGAVPTGPTRIAALPAPAATPAPDRTGGVLALGGVALSAVVCLVAVTLRRGRRRGWRAGRSALS